jgi:DNA-binding PadR family transcriptional regulator
VAIPVRPERGRRAARTRGARRGTSSPRKVRSIYIWGIVDGMSVPLLLLGLLERAPSHGYDLKRDYDTFFGAGRSLPFGQLYATLSRLARDGKATMDEVSPGNGPERKRYVITEQGATEVNNWLTTPVPPEPHLQSVLFAKVILSLMLDRPVEAYLDGQRHAHLARMCELTAAKQSSCLIENILTEHTLFHLEANLRWLGTTIARLDALRAEIRPKVP